MRSTFSKAPESNTDFAATDSDQEVESMTSKFSPFMPSGISCNQCWRSFKSDLTLKNHVLICQGKCQSCEELGVPCISDTTASKKCNGCIALGVVCQGRKERSAGRKEVADPCPITRYYNVGVNVRNATHVNFLASSTIALHTASVAEKIVWCAAAATQQWNTSVHGVDYGW